MSHILSIWINFKSAGLLAIEKAKRDIEWFWEKSWSEPSVETVTRKFRVCVPSFWDQLKQKSAQRRGKWQKRIFLCNRSIRPLKPLWKEKIKHECFHWFICIKPFFISIAKNKTPIDRHETCSNVKWNSKNICRFNKEEKGIHVYLFSFSLIYLKYDETCYILKRKWYICKWYYQKIK
jgi:hypothetical protein